MENKRAQQSGKNGFIPGGADDRAMDGGADICRVSPPPVLPSIPPYTAAARGTAPAPG